MAFAFRLAIVTIFVLSISTSLAEAARTLDSSGLETIVEDSKPKIRFNENGKFRIVNFADL
jgi:hypothetical protein